MASLSRLPFLPIHRRRRSISFGEALGTGRCKSRRLANAGTHAPMSDRQHRADDPPTQPPRFAALPPRTAQAHRIGERVREARDAAHLTQQELGGTIFSKSYLSAVEHGKLTPSVQALARLAERLDRPLSYFLGEDVREPPGEAPEVPAEDVEQTARLREAGRLVQEGRYEEAIALFEQLGEPERLAWAREQYAQFLAAQGRFRDAYEQMRRAIQRSR